jgi:hypothetical protein
MDYKMTMFGNCSIHTWEELADDDLLLLYQQRTFEEADNDAKERDNVQVKEFTLKECEDNFRAVGVVKQKIMAAYPNLGVKHANSPRCE